MEHQQSVPYITAESQENEDEEDERHKISKPEDYYRAFQVFSIDKQGLGLSQIYVIQTMSNTEHEPTWQDLVEIADSVDHNHDGVLEFEEYKQLIEKLKSYRVNEKNKSGKLVYLLCFLFFFPLMGWTAMPCFERIFPTSRFGMRNILKVFGLPYRFRHRILHNIIFFIFFYCAFTLVEILVIVSFVINMSSIVEDKTFQRGYVARIEPILPFYLGCVIFFILPFIFTVEDKKLLEARQKVKAEKLMHQLDVINGNSIQGIQNAEDTMAYIFFQSMEDKVLTQKSEKFRWMASIMMGFIFAFAPFCVRIYRSVPFFGYCMDERLCSRTAPGVECCTDEQNNALIFICVVAFFMTFLLVSWYCFFLTGTYFAFEERLQLTKKLKAMLSLEESEKQRVPFLSFENGTNIIVWSKIRMLVLSFKSVEIAKNEIVLISLLFDLLIVVPFIIYQRMIQRYNINSDVLFVISGIFVISLGIYLAYPTVYSALLINVYQDDIVEFLSHEKWRLAERLDLSKSATEGDDDEKTDLKKSYELCSALHQVIIENDSSFTLLGVKINRGLFVSLVTSIIAGIGSWASSLSIFNKSS